MVLKTANLSFGHVCDVSYGGDCSALLRPYLFFFLSLGTLVPGSLDLSPGGRGGGSLRLKKIQLFWASHLRDAEEHT